MGGGGVFTILQSSLTLYGETRFYRNIDYYLHGPKARRQGGGWGAEEPKRFA